MPSTRTPREGSPRGGGSAAATSIRFLGAADTVTGSRTLVTVSGTRILVDCGLFQGYKVLRDRNHRRFPVDPASIDTVVLTHAHLDHSGYLPALVRDGFRGRVLATPGTVELSRIMLLDSAHLLEEEAQHAANGRWSKHDPAEPLYTVEDAQRALEQFRALPFDEDRGLAAQATVRLVPAGHILGAAGVHLDLHGQVLRLSGDLGRVNDPLMRAPRPLERADVLVCESTYGNRRHEPEDPEAVLGAVVRRVARRRGVVLIPAFAVGRTETVLLHLSRLRDRGEIPDIPIFVNSPMAANVIDLYRRHPEEHRLSPEEIDRVYSLPTIVGSVEESKQLNLRSGPMVIISASGMISGGRILHHIDAFGSDRDNAIVLTGFQAGGTRGATLRSGVRSLRIFGREVPIRAEVVCIDSMSAHADAEELVDWMSTAPADPAQVFLTHGEPSASDALRSRVGWELGWPCRVPEHDERVDLD